MKNVDFSEEKNSDGERNVLYSPLTIEDLHPQGTPDGERHFDTERELVRPNLHSKKVILKVLLVLVFDAAISIIIGYILKKHEYGHYTLIAVLSFASILIIVTISRLKSILIWFVKVYQRFAPERIRRKCVFTPSCSEYMILSLQKYGVIKGLIKGVKRLKRCHLPNHGEDYP